MSGTAHAVLIGIGNPYRRDDGIGPALAEAVGAAVPRGVVAVVTSDGEPAALIDAWFPAEHVVLVDAVRCDAPVPGRIHRRVLVPAPAGALVTAGEPLSAATWVLPGSASSHRMGVADAVRLAAALNMLPRRIIAFGVEAADIGFGPGLSPAVAAAMPDLVQAVLAEFAGG